MTIPYIASKIIRVRDWDNLVKKTYRRPYNFQQQNGCVVRQMYPITVPSEFDERDFENDTVPEIVNGSERGVSFLAWLARDPMQAFEEEGRTVSLASLKLWWHRNFYPDVQTVANDLFMQGLLDEGFYIIDIDW